MRNLEDVINHILVVSTNRSLNKELEKIKRDVRFTAPELMYMRWNLTHEVLCEHIANPIENDETVKIFSIFTTLSEDEFIAKYTSQINN